MVGQRNVTEVDVVAQARQGVVIVETPKLGVEEKRDGKKATLICVYGVVLITHNLFANLSVTHVI